jgi:hypothetical protein
MANIYSNMSQKEKDNERKYLTNLQNSGNAGEKEWASNQLKQLNSASTPSYNQTWESGGRTYVGGVDVGPAGTKVDTSNTSSGISAGIKNNNSGGSSYRPNYGDMGDEMQTNPYEEAYREAERRRQEMEEQIKEQNRIAVEQGTNRLNAQKTNINQAAEDNARQAYIMHMQAKKALPQQLVNQGATGGMTETANLGLQTTYQNNLNDINRNKVNAIQEIDNAIVDLKNTGNLATVEQVLANNQAALDSYMSLLDKGVAYNQWANQYNANRADNAYEQGYQERAYQDALKQQAIENELAFVKNTQTQKQAEEKDTTPVASKNYSNILDNTRGYASSGYYEDNMNGAKYVLGEYELGNLNLGEVKNIIKQANIPIETVARTLKKSFGATDAEISNFVINYYNENISDDYLTKIINFANSKEYVEPTEK